MLTFIAAAVCGSMPIITNSAAPRMKAPEARARMLLFKVSPIGTGIQRARVCTTFEPNVILGIPSTSAACDDTGVVRMI